MCRIEHAFPDEQSDAFAAWQWCNTPSTEDSRPIRVDGGSVAWPDSMRCHVCPGDCHECVLAFYVTAYVLHRACARVFIPVLLLHGVSNADAVSSTTVRTASGLTTVAIAA